LFLIVYLSEIARGSQLFLRKGFYLFAAGTRCSGSYGSF
jgi:hypothetical protein